MCTARVIASRSFFPLVVILEYFHTQTVLLVPQNDLAVLPKPKYLTQLSCSRSVLVPFYTVKKGNEENMTHPQLAATAITRRGAKLPQKRVTFSHFSDSFVH